MDDGGLNLDLEIVVIVLEERREEEGDTIFVNLILVRGDDILRTDGQRLLDCLRFLSLIYEIIAAFCFCKASKMSERLCSVLLSAVDGRWSR